MGKEYGCEVEAVFFDVPVEVCRERNAARARVVPDEALTLMASKLVPPVEAEGFDRVTVVR
jgi:predicted kinase